MTMILNATSLDFSETEATIVDLLASAKMPDSSVQNACAYFAAIQCQVFSLMGKEYHWRTWGLDDLWCESLSRSNHVITLQGTPYWLGGGDECTFFRVDVALDTSPLLYSYKFMNLMKGKQILYVAKTPDGWLVNGA